MCLGLKNSNECEGSSCGKINKCQKDQHDKTTLLDECIVHLKRTIGKMPSNWYVETKQGRKSFKEISINLVTRYETGER